MRATKQEIEAAIRDADGIWADWVAGKITWQERSRQWERFLCDTPEHVTRALRNKRKADLVRAELSDAPEDKAFIEWLEGDWDENFHERMERLRTAWYDGARNVREAFRAAIARAEGGGR